MTDALVLYGNTPLTSPYVFSVYVALEEKGLPFTLEGVNLAAGEQKEASYLARSFNGKVPLLRHNDFWLAESSAITEYLEDAFAPPRYTALYPRDIQSKARVRLAQAVIRSDFVALREERPTRTIFGAPADQPLTEKGRADAEKLLHLAGALLDRHKTGVAESFSIADADLAITLQRLVANRHAVPALITDFVASVWSRPSVQSFVARTKALPMPDLLESSKQ